MGLGRAYAKVLLTPKHAYKLLFIVSTLSLIVTIWQVMPSSFKFRADYTRLVHCYNTMALGHVQNPSREKKCNNQGVLKYNIKTTEMKRNCH